MIHLIQKIEILQNILKDVLTRLSKRHIQPYDFNYEVVWLYFFVRENNKFSSSPCKLPSFPFVI